MPPGFSPSTEPTYPAVDFAPRTSNAQPRAERAHDHCQTASPIAGDTTGRSTTPLTAAPEPYMQKPMLPSSEIDKQLLTRALAALKRLIDDTPEADPVARVAVLEAYIDLYPRSLDVKAGKLNKNLDGRQ